MNTIAKFLGLKDDATEAECLAALTKIGARAESADQARAALEGRVLAATGASSFDAAIGTIGAWKACSELVPTLEAKVKGLEDAAETKERDALVAQGVADRKLTPALKEWAATQSVASLKAFLDKAPAHPLLSAPKAAGTSEPVQEPSIHSTDLGGKRWEDMKPSEKATIYKSNRPLYDALKADHERRTANED